MKVSVIVPIFKVEKEIESCLISIIEQDYPNIEIILVDDCSPDNSFQIAKNIIKKYDFVDKTQFIYHDQNHRISVARNSGLIAATGDYVFLQTVMIP